jgi:hypothetical protein
MADAPEPKSTAKTLAYRVGLGFFVVGLLLLETGIPGLIVLVAGIISLIYSGFFDRFRPSR